MEWFFIEALFALAVGIAIVWWTMAPQKKLPRAVNPKSVDPESGDAKSGHAKSDAATKAKL